MCPVLFVEHVINTQDDLPTRPVAPGGTCAEASPTRRAVRVDANIPHVAGAETVLGAGCDEPGCELPTVVVIEVQGDPSVQRRDAVGGLLRVRYSLFAMCKIQHVRLVVRPASTPYIDDDAELTLCTMSRPSGVRLPVETEMMRSEYLSLNAMISNRQLSEW